METESRLNRKRLFIRAMALFLTKDMAGKSIMLEMERRDARLIAGTGKPRFATEWADLYQSAGLHGWVTLEEAENQLMELLG